MTLIFLTYLLILLLAAFIGGLLFKLIKQPPVVGYLLAGLFLGMAFGGSFAHQTIEILAELGIVLLLFTLGVEFSLHKLKKVARIAVAGGLVQILGTIVVLSILIQFFGFDFYAALFMAAAFSLSSTAIVVKILTDKGEMDTLHGEIMVAWLVVQDLAVLPMMVFLPTIGQKFFGGDAGINAWLIILQNLLFVGSAIIFLFLLAQKIIPFLVDKVASLNNRELLLVSVFGFAVLGALLTQAFGFSAALGAFLVGLTIAETTQKHAIFSEIRPLRDIFSLLFFITLGLVIPGGFIYQNLGLIAGITLTVITVKFVIVLILTYYQGYHSKTSFIVSLGLIEVGEFAFILARVGLNTQVIDLNTYGMILSVSLLSILAMPPLYFSAPYFYARLQNFTKRRLHPVYSRFFAKYEHHDTLIELPFENHVVLCGYGRVGKYIGRALEMAAIPFIVIEYNQNKANELKRKGLTVVYGDPADIDILDFAQVDKARSLVIAIPDLQTQKQVVTNSLSLNKNIEILCRTHHEDEQKLLRALGVTTIIQPEFEAALTVVNKLLKTFGNTAGDIDGKISRLKLEHGLG